jgi:retron-type reverse transcriptase
VPDGGLDQPVGSGGLRAGSAERSARAVRRTDGLDPLQALQRVLYRSAKQDRSRRFHALYDKLTRSDVMWRAWSDVAANRGVPGVDGVSVDAVRAGGVEGVTSFLGELAAKVADGSYRPAALRRVYIPKPGQPVDSGRCRSRRWSTGW